MASAKGMSGATVRSFRAAAKKIAKAANEVRVLLPQALLMIGEEVMRDVKDSRPGHGVPVRTGVLRGTGAVTPVGSPGSPKVELSFGGAAAPYALIQHEVTTFKHKTGEPRYLVRGLERWSPGGSAAMADLKARAKASTTGTP